MNTTTSGIAPLSYESILPMIEHFIQISKEFDLLGAWMRDKGFPPETSLLVLPESARTVFPVLPDYVAFSRVIPHAYLIKDIRHDRRGNA